MKTKLKCDSCGHDVNVEWKDIYMKCDCKICSIKYSINFKYRLILRAVEMLVLVGIVMKIFNYYQVPFWLMILFILVYAVLSNYVDFLLVPWYSKRGWVRLKVIEDKKD